MQTNLVTALQQEGGVVDTVYNWIVALAERVETLPASAALVVCLIALGYVLKAVRVFPNRYIPVALLAVGAVANWAVGDISKVSPSVRYPGVLLAIHGLILAFVAWVLHNRVLKRLESKFPWLKNVLPSEGNTERFPRESESDNGD